MNVSSLFLVICALLCTSASALSQQILRPRWISAASGRGLALSPDETKLITWSGSTMSIWDCTDGSIIGTVPGSSTAIQSVVWNSESTLFAADFQGGDVCIWDATSLRELGRRGTDGLSQFYGLRFSKDGEVLMSCQTDGRQKATLMHARDASVIRTVDLSCIADLHSLQFSDDEKRVLAKPCDSVIRIWDIQTEKVVLQLNHPAARVTSASYVPGTNRIVSCDHNGMIRIWNASDGMQIHEFPTGSLLDCTDYLSSKSLLCLGLADGSVVLYSLIDNRIIWRQTAHLGYLQQVRISPKGNYILSKANNEPLRVLRIQDGSMLKEIASAKFSTSWTVDSSEHYLFFAAGGRTTQVRLDNDQSVREYADHTAAFLAIDLSPDQLTLASSSADSTIRLWDARSGKLIHCFREYPHAFNSLVFHPDGQHLYSSTSNGRIQVWDIGAKKLIRDLPGPGMGLNRSSWNRSGTEFITRFDPTKSLQIWNAETGTIEREFSGHTGGIGSAVFSADGTTILSSSLRAGAFLWNSQTGFLNQQLSGYTEDLYSAQYNSNESLVVGSGTDSTIVLWATTDGRIVQRLHDGPLSLQNALFVNNDTQILGGGNHVNPKLWDINTSLVTKEYSCTTSNATQFSKMLVDPSAKYFVCTTTNGNVYLWSLAQSENLAVMPGHLFFIRDIIFDRSTSRLFTADDSGLLR